MQAHHQRDRVTNELATYDAAITKRVNQIVDCLDSLSPDERATLMTLLQKIYKQ